MKIIGNTDDGYLRNDGNNFNTVWTATDALWVTTSGEDVWCGDFLAFGQYYIWRVILFFDTSFLPTKYLVKRAKLYFYCGANYMPVGEYLHIQMGTNSVPHKPLVAGDYDKTHYSGDYGHILSADVVVDDWNSIDIPASQLGCFNPSGFTKFCLRTKKEIDGIAPLGNERILLASANHPTYKPYLILETALTGDRTIVANKVSLEAIRNIEVMNSGRFYVSKSGDATYESRFHR